MEVEVERLNGLLLRRLATPNESPGAAAVGGSTQWPFATEKCESTYFCPPT